MRVLLPPSETKRTGGLGALDATTLFAADRLDPARTRVRRALVALSRRARPVAAKALKLGVKNQDEVLFNLALDSSGVLPAIERYTGVVFDALDVSAFAQPAREWVDSRVFLQSALFGLVRASDQIPAYRLSHNTSLPGLRGSSLRAVWSRAHEGIQWPDRTLTLDLRSSGYVQLADIPGAVRLDVVCRDGQGNTRPLGHFNKAAKGALVQLLAEDQCDAASPGEFVEWAISRGLDVCTAESRNGDVSLTYVAPISHAVGENGSRS